MRVKYDEGSDALVVAESGQTVVRGEVAEVDDDLGARLVAQGPWVEVKTITKRGQSPEKE